MDSGLQPWLVARTEGWDRLRRRNLKGILQQGVCCLGVFDASSDDDTLKNLDNPPDKKCQLGGIYLADIDGYLF